MRFWFFFFLCLFNTLSFAAKPASHPEKQYPAFEKAKKQTPSKWFPTHYNDLWQQVAHDFSLPHYENTPEVQEQIRWFQRNPDFLAKISDHAQLYMYYVYHEVKKRHLPVELVLLPMIESAYDPFAYSWVGAAGIWQMMPATASGYGLKQNWWFDGRKAIQPSTQAALDYLSYLQSFFNGNWLLAVAAYNAGEGRVQSAVNKNQQQGLKTRFWDLALPQETKNYVPRLLALAAIVSNPARYHVKLDQVPNQPFFTDILIDKQMDLSQVAKLAQVDTQSVYELNPGFTRWASDPDSSFRLLLPISKMTTFRINYANYTAKKEETSSHYIVKKADTLENIAQKYQMDKQKIIEANELSSGKVSAGQNLFIPSLESKTETKQVAKEESVRTPTQTEKPVQNAALTATTPPASTAVPTKALQADTNKTTKTASAAAKQKTYTVKKGDTLSSIARKNQLSVQKLIQLNKIKGKTIKPGQKLRVS